jgi:hypothetical protein
LRGVPFSGASKSLRLQLQPGLNSAWVIHGKDVNRRSSYLGKAENPPAVGGEVLRPFISARIEKSRQVAGAGVYAGEVRAFMMVAVVASESEVGHVIGAMVLQRRDVLNMEGDHVMPLVDLAILTAVAGPRANVTTGLGVHQPPVCES